MNNTKIFLRKNRFYKERSLFMEKNIDIYNKKEDCIIKGKEFYIEEENDNNQIFIFCHGFCSGKGSSSVRIVAERLLQYGIKSISFLL